MNDKIKSIRARNAQTSPLLTLPRKLRNHCYRCVLYNEEVVVDLQTVHGLTSLLRVSSQIPKEAKATFYEENTFITTNPISQQLPLRTFLEWIGKDNTSRINCIRVCLEIPANWTTIYKITEEMAKAGRPVQDVCNEIVRVMGSKGRRTAGKITDGLIEDSRIPFAAMASDLVDFGVGLKNMQLHNTDEWYASPDDNPSVEEQAVKAFVQALNLAFLKTIKAKIS